MVWWTSVSVFSLVDECFFFAAFLFWRDNIRGPTLQTSGSPLYESLVIKSIRGLEFSFFSSVVLYLKLTQTCGFCSVDHFPVPMKHPSNWPKDLMTRKSLTSSIRGSLDTCHYNMHWSSLSARGLVTFRHAIWFHYD